MENMEQVPTFLLALDPIASPGPFDTDPFDAPPLDDHIGTSIVVLQDVTIVESACTHGNSLLAILLLVALASMLQASFSRHREPAIVIAEPVTERVKGEP